jgi:hypothetical protein
MTWLDLIFKISTLNLQELKQFNRSFFPHSRHYKSSALKHGYAVDTFPLRAYRLAQGINQNHLLELRL